MNIPLTKKNIFFSVIITIMLCCCITHAEPNVEFLNCNISKVVFNASSDIGLLRVTLPNGEQVTYDFADRIRINGKFYYNYNDICNAVPQNSFAKIALEGGKASVVNFGTDVTSYKNVEYNQRKRCFSVLNPKRANLPVYYKYDDSFETAYIDNHHFYDIDVYDYAICITDMRTKNAEATVKVIDVSSAANSDFTQSIGVYCKTDAVGEYVIKGKLYDKYKRLVGESQSDENGELGFFGLNNADATYTVKIWIEDKEGRRLSAEYVTNHTVKKAEVKSVYISKVVYNVSSDTGLLRVTLPNGEKVTYDFADKVRINGKIYRNYNDICNALTLNSFAKIAVENGAVTVLNFDANPKTYQNAEYDSEEKVFAVNGEKTENLPVYYKYDDEFVSVYTDENHYYDIEVSNYAICITDMRTKNAEATVKVIDVSSAANSDFTQSIGVYCKTDAVGEYVIKGKLYDKYKRLVGESQSDESGELEFFGLSNADATYTVKIWIEDKEGGRLSTEYVTNHTVKKAEVKSVYISKAVFNGATDAVRLRFTLPNGELATYETAERVRINGKIYRVDYRGENILNALTLNSFAKIAVENDVVTVLNFDANPKTYQNAEYDSEEKVFAVNGGKTENLPVYYKYNDEFVSAYTDENHYYDIEVSNYAICITDMRAKNAETTVKVIDIGSAVGSDFKQRIVVYCETDGSNQYTIKGKLYNKIHKPIASAKGQCDGFGEIVFEHIENKAMDCTAEIWLEDLTGKKVSNSYVIGKRLRENKIKFGNVLFEHMSDNNGDEIILGVRGIDGTENVYVCDSNTLFINGAEAFSARSAGASLEDAFVKMAVDDGVVSAVVAEPSGLEIYSEGYSYNDGMNGSAYVLNNTQEAKKFVCYMAIYNSQNVMKWCDTISVDVDKDDIFPLVSDFEEYEYSAGDYMKIFAWENDIGITPLAESCLIDIT